MSFGHKYKGLIVIDLGEEMIKYNDFRSDLLNKQRLDLHIQWFSRFCEVYQIADPRLKQELTDLYLPEIDSVIEAKSDNHITSNLCVEIIGKLETLPQGVIGRVSHALREVKGLKRGRGGKERPKVKPVPEAAVEAVLPLVSFQVAAMIQLQLLTGMRPAEVCAMRAADLDMSKAPWVYTPAAHKTEHHDIDRFIYFGPRAQDAIRPFFKTDLQAHLFSPAEAEAKRNAEKRASRESPMTPSQRRRKPKGNCYRSVEDGAIEHKLQPWLHDAKRHTFNPKTGESKLVSFDSNSATIKGALEAIRNYTYLTSSITPPTWLTYSSDDLDPRECLVGKSSTLHIPSGTVIPPTPNLFATAALEFDYRSDAPTPNTWLNFLHQLWEDDQEQISTLQDWFGYRQHPPQIFR
jgi:integrase